MTGYAHSANGLEREPAKHRRQAALRRARREQGRQHHRTRRRPASGRCPSRSRPSTPTATASITADELLAEHQADCRQAAEPGHPGDERHRAQEICVTTAMGVCDFISAMDTDRVPEWNCWYHIMNCGFPLKVSRRDRLPVHHRQPRRPGPRLRAARQDRQGRLRRVVQGHRQGPLLRLRRLRPRPGVQVNGTSPGFGEVKLDAAGPVKVTAKVAFAKDVPLGTAPGGAGARSATRARSNWSSTARSWRRRTCRPTTRRTT